MGQIQNSINSAVSSVANALESKDRAETREGYKQQQYLESQIGLERTKENAIALQQASQRNEAEGKIVSKQAEALNAAKPYLENQAFEASREYAAADFAGEQLGVDIREGFEKYQQAHPKSKFKDSDDWYKNSKSKAAKGFREDEKKYNEWSKQVDVNDQKAQTALTNANTRLNILNTQAEQVKQRRELLAQQSKVNAAQTSLYEFQSKWLESRGFNKAALKTEEARKETK